jgi:hypothetical protein
MKNSEKKIFDCIEENETKLNGSIAILQCVFDKLWNVRDNDAMNMFSLAMSTLKEYSKAMQEAVGNAYKEESK